jgi:hypothetical protein
MAGWQGKARKEAHFPSPHHITTKQLKKLHSARLLGHIDVPDWLPASPHFRAELRVALKRDKYVHTARAPKASNWKV